MRLQPGNMWGPANNAKNVLIRAVKGSTAGPAARRAYEELRDSLGLDPALERLLGAA